MQHIFKIHNISFAAHKTKDLPKPSPQDFSFKTEALKLILKHIRGRVSSHDTKGPPLARSLLLPG